MERREIKAFIQKATDVVKSRAREGAAAVVLLTAAAAACKGGEGQGVETTPTQPANSPVATETIAPTPTATATVEVPQTSEQTKPPLKKLSEARYVSTDFQTLAKSLNDAFDLHPEANNVVDEGGNQLNRERLTNNLNRCQSGGEDPRTIELDRAHMCASLSYRAIIIYQKTGIEQFYQVAVDSANYLLTELPHRKYEFDVTLEPFAHDTSPSLEEK